MKMTHRIMAFAVLGLLSIGAHALGVSLDPLAVSMAGMALAVEAIKSNVITNATATPSVINTSQRDGSVLRHKRGQCAVDAAASIGSTYRMFRVKSNDLVSQLMLDCSAITSAAGDIGLYQTADNGGAVVDADFFASAQSLASALRATDITRESGIITMANFDKPIWEQLGLTEDPHREYDVVVTLTAAATAAGNVALVGHIVGKS